MAKKIILIVFGLVILLIGLTVTALGAAGLVFGGHAGEIRSGYHAVGTPTYAFVSDAEHVRRGQNIEVRSGNATLHVDARDATQPLFVGVGPAQQVESYLKGAAYVTVTDVNFGPFRLDTHAVAGTGRPAAPGDQSFWVAKASGTSPRLSWPIANGQYRLVVMNTNSSAGVQADVRVGVGIPGLFGASLGTTIAGGLLSLLGLGLLIWGIMARRKLPPVAPGYAPQAGGYPPPGGYPESGQYPPPAGYPPQGGYPPPAGYPAQPGYSGEPGYPDQPGETPPPGYPPPEYGPPPGYGPQPGYGAPPGDDVAPTERPPGSGDDPYRPPPMPASGGAEQGTDETVGEPSRAPDGTGDTLADRPTGGRHRSPSTPDAGGASTSGQRTDEPNEGER